MTVEGELERPAFLTARWINLLLATYAVPPELVASYLPAGIEPDARDGRAFASLVAFDFRDTRVLGVAWPGFRNFPEVNLRGNVFRPLVVGPESVPRIDDVRLAERDPELAILSVMAHGHEAHAEALGRAALSAIQHLPDDRQVIYSDLVLSAVSKAARAALEELMASGNYEFQSDFEVRVLAEFLVVLRHARRVRRR